jgi:hypothetical protein
MSGLCLQPPKHEKYNVRVRVALSCLFVIVRVQGEVVHGHSGLPLYAKADDRHMDVAKHGRGARLKRKPYFCEREFGDQLKDINLSQSSHATNTPGNLKKD